jgi:two-component SAPR family response regulator
MTGAELAKAIRAEWPTISIILASGFAEAPSDIVAMTRLAKPFTQEELAEKIASLYSQTGKKGRVVRLRQADNPKTNI